MQVAERALGPGAVFPAPQIKFTLAKEYICSPSFQHIEVQICHIVMTMMMLLGGVENIVFRTLAMFLYFLPIEEEKH